MIYRDFYANSQKKMEHSLNTLVQASKMLEEAKEQRDKETRKQAEKQIKKAARQAVDIDPHLAYLLLEARDTKDGKYIRDAWEKTIKAKDFSKEFGFIPDVSVVTRLPFLSFLLHIPFQLRKPFLSKDECEFYLIDNPLRKEKIWQVPMIAPTSWKGALRSALRLACNYEEENDVIIRLFGYPQESEEQQAGRLYFFPTFFKQISLEVINPHDRKTGVGTKRGPIPMECVPVGATGEFVVLYMFFGPIELSKKDKYYQVSQDLVVLAEGIRAMLITYGFGAKTSSGFGIAENKLNGEGKLAIRAKVGDRTFLTNTPPVSKFSFSTLCDLCDLANRLAEKLRGGEGDE